jgi:hypothetical protein
MIEERCGADGGACVGGGRRRGGGGSAPTTLSESAAQLVAAVPRDALEALYRRHLMADEFALLTIEDLSDERGGPGALAAAEAVARARRAATGAAPGGGGGGGGGGGKYFCYMGAHGFGERAKESPRMERRARGRSIQNWIRLFLRGRGRFPPRRLAAAPLSGGRRETKREGRAPSRVGIVCSIYRFRRMVVRARADSLEKGFGALGGRGRGGGQKWGGRGGLAAPREQKKKGMGPGGGGNAHRRAARNHTPVFCVHNSRRGGKEGARAFLNA